MDEAILSDERKLMGVCALVVLLACTPGEAPRVPDPEPGGEPAVEAPGDGAGEAPAAPAPGSERAASLLAEAQLAYEHMAVEEALRLSEQVIREHAGTGAAVSARWVAARAAFALERYDRARELALSYAEAQRGTELGEKAAVVADLAADAQESPREAVVGVVLPRSGSRVLVRYADWVLEGIQLAVAQAEAEQNRRIRLVVADDSGGLRTREAVRELEDRGAVAILGPLLPQQLSAAVGARSGSRPVIVSPTVTDRPRWPEVFSVNASDTRGAQELGQYAADLGFTRAAVLYPRIAEYERKARAFEVEFESHGGEVRAVVPYDSGTTTFQTHLRRILTAMGPEQPYDSLAAERLLGEEAQPSPGDTGAMAPGVDTAGAELEPFALFVAAPQRDVPQIAPQVAFYGLDSAGVQVFGDEAWASAGVRRVVPSRDLQGVLASSNFPPDRAGAAADPAFVRAYEERYRRSFDSSNQLPALGYDAALLVTQALPNRMLSPGAFARRFELLTGIRGATGLLSVRAGRIIRTPYLVVIRDGALEPAPYPWEYQLPAPVPPREAVGGRR